MGNDGAKIEFLRHWSRSLLPGDFPWDVYWEWKYFKAFENIDEGEPCAFLFTRDQNCWFHAFFRRSIPNSDYFDLKTPYGYGGPLSNSDSEEFCQEANEAFIAWTKQQNIVCEFVRFHPLLENWNWCLKAKIEINRQTVFIDLTKDFETLSREMSSSFLRGVKKGNSAGLLFRELDLDRFLPDFQNLYQSTMKRVNASTFYFFPLTHFFALKDMARLFGVFRDARLVSAALLIYSGNFIHYHLGASSESDFLLRPNNFLFYQTIKSLHAEKRWAKLHIGGGSDRNPQNTLFRFKSSFGIDRASFKTGKRVFSPQIYQKLSDSNQLSIKDKIPADVFPLYRYGEIEENES